MVTIKPQLSNLKNCSIIVPTIKGQIKANYLKKSKLETEYNIELPGNMIGEFLVNLSSEDELLVNGQSVNTMFKSVRLQPGQNKIEIKINTF
jgi:hypothetical protein